METYRQTYISDWGQEQQKNIVVGLKKPEHKHVPNGYLIPIQHVPVAFTAYSCWAWDHYGALFTNMMFKISPYHMWCGRPSYENSPLETIVQIEFLIQAFRKRIVNKKIRQQEHTLFANLTTCDAEKNHDATHAELRKLCVMMKEFVTIPDHYDPPTPPKPDECNYNDYIVYRIQHKMMYKLQKSREIKKIKQWKEKK